MPAIGYVTRQEDGSFKGQLRALTIRRHRDHEEPHEDTESQPCTPDDAWLDAS